MIITKPNVIERALTQKSQHSLATFISFFCLGLCTAAWAPLIPYAQQRLNLNHADFGGLLLCGGLGSMIAMPAAGYLIQKVGCRSMIAAFLLVLMFTLPLMTLAPSAAMLAILLFIFGSAAGGLGVVMNYQAVVVEKKLTQNLMSSFHGMCSLGGLGGVMAVTLLLSVGVPPFFSAVLIGFILLILVCVAVPHSLKKSEISDLNTQNTDDSSHSLNTPKKWMMPPPLILVFGLMCFIAFLTEGSAMEWSGIYLVDQFKMDAAYAGLAYTFFAIAMTIGRFSGHWVLRLLGEKKTIIYGAMLAAIGLSTVIIAPIWTVALLGYFLMGLGCSNIVPIIFSQVGRQNVMPKAVALSYVSTMAYSGVLLGPAFIGLGSEILSLTAVFTVLAVAVILIPLLNMFTRSKQLD